MDTPTLRKLDGNVPIGVEIELTPKLYQFLWDKGLENLDVKKELNFLGWIRPRLVDEYIRKLVEKHFREMTENGRGK